MLNLQRLTIDYFVEELKSAYTRTYSDIEPQFLNIIAWSGRLVLENIANSDALYHNVEHTVMVTLAGQSILEGKHLIEGGVTPKDWLHFTLALLCHDIGYVKGVCKLDQKEVFSTGLSDDTTTLPIGSSDIALTPFHVDRSKLFVKERFGSLLLNMEQTIDADLIGSYIEMTRFPVPNDPDHEDTTGYAGLVRAADLIGQLGDPNYHRKVPALYYEFEEIGANKDLGYDSPGTLRENYARFYWDVVRPYIKHATKYLRVTQEGKQWLAHLYSHVFSSEHNVHS